MLLKDVYNKGFEELYNAMLATGVLSKGEAEYSHRFTTTTTTTTTYHILRRVISGNKLFPCQICGIDHNLEHFVFKFIQEFNGLGGGDAVVVVVVVVVTRGRRKEREMMYR